MHFQSKNYKKITKSLNFDYTVWTQNAEYYAENVSDSVNPNNVKFSSKANFEPKVSFLDFLSK
jgi:hypothetical protein